MRLLRSLYAVLLILTVATACANNTYRANFPLPTGKNFTGASVTIRSNQPTDAEFQKIAKSGFKYVRMNIWWQNVEPVAGVYVFTAYDQIIATAATYGLRLNLIFDPVNPLYGSDVASKTQPFINYATACVTHFAGKGVLWEMMNEPDLSGLTVSDYMTLEHGAAQSIRGVQPEEYLIGPSVSSIVLTNPLSFLKGCLDAGILNDVDAVTVHPYIHDTPETIAGPFSAVRTLINSYPGGSSKLIFASEWGYPSMGLPIVLTPRPYTNGLPNILADSNNFSSNTSWKGWYLKPTFLTGISDPVGGFNATRMLTADYSPSAGLGYSGIVQLGTLVKGDYYIASVYLRSTGGVQSITMGLNDHDKISFTIDGTWRRCSFSFIDLDPWNQNRVLQITEWGLNNPAWDVYGAQLEHVGQLTPAIIDTAQRNLQGGFMVRAYKACLANKIPYMSWFEWFETPTAPGCGLNKMDGTPYPALTAWQTYYSTSTGPWGR